MCVCRGGGGGGGDRTDRHTERMCGYGHTYIYICMSVCRHGYVCE